MNRKALVVIDIQNDITKHYRDIIEKINSAIDWAMKQGMAIIYVKHNNLSAGTRTFKPDTKGAELVPELKIVSDHIFVKTKASALTSEAFSEFIRSKDIREFYITGADATACVKSTCYNMVRAGYTVHVISDCVTSYDLKKIPEMLAYYTDKGCEVGNLAAFMGMDYQYRRLDNNNFTGHSLDDFVRHQTVTECWRKIDNDWKLVPNVYEENWSQVQCREIAEDVVHNINLDQTGFGAFDGERIIGFATVSHRIFGTAARYVQLVCLQISEEYRRQGIGRKLFSMACEEARRLGADKLYISGHSSKESQAAYRALGCTPAEEVNEGLAAAEPFDVQLEYRLDEKKNQYIAYCGLNCEKCEARLATVNNDNELRIKVAGEWSELNAAEITPEMINCTGCRIDGVKTPYCDSLCPIRQCALERTVETCGNCPEMETCEKLSMITGNNAEALKNLQG